MMSEHQTTREEEAYWRLLDDNWEMLSEAGRTIIRKAEYAAYTDNMVHNYCFQPEEYEEAIERMRLAADNLKGRDAELLAELVRAAMVAASSFDQYDYETLVGYKVCRYDLHWYYRMVFSMVDEILQAKKVAEFQTKCAERKTTDLSDIPS